MAGLLDKKKNIYEAQLREDKKDFHLCFEQVTEKK